VHKPQQAQNTAAEEQAVAEEQSAQQGGGGDSPTDAYVNRNPKATLDEVRLGALLHDLAKTGHLPGVKQVEGTPELPGRRSGDYRFILNDGRVIAADLYQPESANVRSIAANIMQKSGQATVVIIELGRGNSDQLGDAAAIHIAQSVLETPGHTIQRVLVIKHNVRLADRFRAL
jgi:hypothetical protein